MIDCESPHEASRVQAEAARGSMPSRCQRRHALRMAQPVARPAGQGRDDAEQQWNPSTALAASWVQGSAAWGPRYAACRPPCSRWQWSCRPVQQARVAAGLKAQQGLDTHGAGTWQCHADHVQRMPCCCPPCSALQAACLYHAHAAEDADAAAGSDRQRHKSTVTTAVAAFLRTH